MQPVADETLVSRCLAGDQDAWRDLVERYSRYVYAIVVQAYRLPADRAEDVYQETFARIYTHLETLRDPGALRPWIAQLTRRQCLDALRGDARERSVDVEALDEVDAAAEEVLLTLEEAWDVRAALEALSPECRDVLDRFFCCDQSYRTIGEELGLPSGTIASRISRCLTRMRNQLLGRSDAISASSRSER